jgi:DNA polymerase-1
MEIEATSKDAYQLLHDGAIALAQVESNGIKINTDLLDKTILDLEASISTNTNALKNDPVYSTWRKRFGDKTKLGSREQLGIVVFSELGYESKEKTATGRDKADEKAFDHIDLPFVKTWLKIERQKKMSRTFLSGIRKETINGYLHPFFNLHTVSSFRSSSTNPNFQNLPMRNSEFAKLIRTCFIPRKGRRLVEIDYSGIEVRIAACYHKDKNMLKYIKDPTTDMHRDMAMQIFCLEKDQVEKKTSRDWSKNRFVFPEFYGSVYFQCAKHIWEVCGTDQYKLPNGTTFKQHLMSKGITKLGRCDPKEKPVKGTFEEHLKKVEENFWGVRFKEYATWKDNWYNDYRKTASFKTLTGFTIGGLMKRNEVINLPVQGAAFHCLLQSLVWIQQHINKYKWKTKIVGQIHDSIIADVCDTELDDYLSIAKEIMTVRLLDKWKWINVPLDVEADVTEIDGNWYEKEQWIEKEKGWAKK